MKNTSKKEVIDIELSPLELLSSGQLIVRAEAKLTVNDFGEAFKEKAELALASLENKLESDEDFEKAERDIKACKITEDKLKVALEDITSGNKEIAEVKATIEKYISSFAKNRIDLNKAVTRRDKEKKESITSAGVKKVADAVTASPAKCHFTPNNPAIIAAIKNKSKYSVMEKCVAEVVASELKRLAELEAIYLTNTTAIDKAKLEYPTLFPDREALSVQPVDVISLTIESRITAHKLAEKERLEREEAARKAKEEAEKRRAEEYAEKAAHAAEEKRIADEKAEADRIAAEKVAAEAKVSPTPLEVPENTEEKQASIEPPPIQQDSAWQPPAFSPLFVAPPPPPVAKSVYIRVEVQPEHVAQVVDAIAKFPSVLSVVLE